MIIKDIIIKNFRSYYGENKFTFSNGLTLIIGDNGDGSSLAARRWIVVCDGGSDEECDHKRKDIQLLHGLLLFVYSKNIKFLMNLNFFCAKVWIPMGKIQNSEF